MSADGEVGVVIATHNRRESLLRTLAHLAALPEQPATMVVDNGSGDGTAPAVAASFPGVRLLRLDRNLGAAARNLGAAQIGTPVVAFSDDDSWWAPRALATAAGTFRRHPRLGLIAARVLVGEERRLDPVSTLMEGPTPPGLPGPRVDGFLACGAVVRREAFLAAGGFCAQFLIGSEESLLATDMRAAGWDLCYRPDVVAFHHPHSGGRPDREWLHRRNDLWASWLRAPATQALRDTATLALAATRDRPARHALGSALRGAPWAWRARRSPGSVDRSGHILRSE